MSSLTKIGVSQCTNRLLSLTYLHCEIQVLGLVGPSLCCTGIHADSPVWQLFRHLDQIHKFWASRTKKASYLQISVWLWCTNTCFVSALVLHWVGTKLYMAIDSLYFFFLQITDPHMCSDSGCSCLVLYGLITKNGIAPYICTASDYHSHSIFYKLLPSWISALAHPRPLSSSA